MDINFFFEDFEGFVFNKSKDKKWILKCIKEYKKTAGDINFIFCSDPYLLEINKKYLDHDYFTDIITFNNCDEDIISGDIYISIDRVKENAEELKEDFNNELHRVMIHGILHLLGLNDSTEKEKIEMRNAEDGCLYYYA